MSYGKAAPKADNEEQDEKTPAEWAKHWTRELAGAKKELAPWHQQGEKIIKRFLDKREATDETNRLNLFTANIQTLRALLYGKTPQVDVTRRFADHGDDVARVAAEMLERLLNTDIERESDNYSTALQCALDDRLLAGLGNVRVLYTADFDQDEGKPEIPAKAANDNTAGGAANEDAEQAPAPLAPAVPPQEYKSREDVVTEYVYWRDQLWSPSRTFHEVRWWAFRALMPKKAFVARFGKDMAAIAPFAIGGSERSKDTDDQGAKAHPEKRAEVWEVWDKERERVFWYVDGCPVILESKPDPLELEGFWPFARPMFANLTTSGLVPRPDYVLSQDLYAEIDAVSSRIAALEKSVKVVGVYDAAATGLKRMLDEGQENVMLPVDKWAAFAERGGLKGAVDWLPIEPIVAAMDKLRELRTELMGLSFQVTGMSDIMRGEASGPATATEQSIKARFASVRVQALQDEFARFASDVQRIKAEIICKFFDDKTILERSNIQYTPDAQFGQPAVALLKSQFECYRIEVKPEAVSLTDFAALKAERSEYIQALSTFLQAMVPAAQGLPQSTPMLLELLQWGLAGFKGASTIEGVLDKAIAQAEHAIANPQPPPPDPKLQAAQMKSQSDQMKAQADMQKTQMKSQVDSFKAQADMQRAQVDAQAAGQKNQFDAAKPHIELQADLTRIQAEANAETLKQQNQAFWNIKETAANEAIKDHYAPEPTMPKPGGGL